MLLIGLLSGAIVGVLVDYLLGFVLPKNPTRRHVFAVVTVIVVFGIIATKTPPNFDNSFTSTRPPIDEGMKSILATMEARDVELLNAIATVQFLSQNENDIYAPTATALAQQREELESARQSLMVQQPELVDIPNTPTPLPASSINFPSNPGLGSVYVRPDDGMIMAFVPGGTFLMGSTEDDPVAESNEIPQHVVTVNGFWLDKTEVTNTQYIGFLNAQNKSLSDMASWIELDSEFNRISHNNGVFEALASFADYPVVEVSWAGANEYCRWIDARLPTEEEWEYAARGTDQRLYPWGNNFDGMKLNFCDVNCPRDWRNSAFNDGYAMTAPVGSFPTGQSWVGILDLAGNVAEWTANGLYAYEENDDQNPLFLEGGFHKVVRGGSWTNTNRFTRVTNRTYPSPNEQSEFVGFRCAATP